MVNLEIIPTTRAHIYELIDTIRDDDKREIEAWGCTCARGIWTSYKASLVTKTALIDGKVAGVWGLGGTALGFTGRPWFLSTPEIYKISPLQVAKIYRREALKMFDIFSRLENYVDANYPEAIRLMKIAGFSIEEPKPIGYNKAMFCKFYMDKRAA